MLGKFHGSVEHLYVPRLINLNREAPVSSKQSDTPINYCLFKLGWDAVDEFKQNHYREWVAKHWKGEHPKELCDQVPTTLPKQYDDIIKNMVYAIPHSYHIEIEHFAQLYYQERHRIRHFDTVIRDMCLKVSQTAIGCAFKLLADCTYDAQNQTWLRETPEFDRFMIEHLLMYKFWREATGRGLVWDHAEMDRLEEVCVHIEHGGDGYYKSSMEMIKKYRRCAGELRMWEEEQEKFYSFAVLEKRQSLIQNHLSLGS